ncbi:MAG: mannosyltransferase family protein [Myxococcota bacterium]
MMPRGHGVLGMPPMDGPEWMQSWFRWDSGWYLRIIREGYSASHCGLPEGPCQQASISFFPAYPLTVRFLSATGLPVTVASFLLNAVCLVLALWALKRLATKLLGEECAATTGWVLLAYPSTIFFTAGYAEALFAASTLWAVVLIAEGRAWHAAPLLAVGALARPHGLVLVGACVLGALVRRQWLRALPLALLPSLAVGAYMAWQQSAFGDPLAFIHARKAWFAPVPPLVNIQNYWDSLISLPSPLLVLDFSSVVLLGVTAVWAFRRLPAEYGLYTLLLVVLPLANGQVWGMGRGALGAFPVFLMLASLATPARRVPLLVVGVSWATVMGVLFVNGLPVG